MTLAERLEKYYEPEPMSGCWIWFGSSNPRGYGRVKGSGKKVELAHRVSWMLFNGPIPEGMCVLHRCDNPSCINPGHLFIGTYLDNNRDRARKGRSRPRRGANHGRAKLDEPKVVQIRNRIDSGERQQDIADEFGVSKSLIQAIDARKIWRHVS